MTPTETRAVLGLGLLAAFVDGDKHERERAEIKRIAEGLSGDAGTNLPSLYQDVLMKRVSIASVAGDLQTLDARQLAYEMAVCVCDADGMQSDTERAFLEEARAALKLSASGTADFVQQAGALAEAPLALPDQPASLSGDDAARDRSILNAAILNGALELLPESLSTMAIIPLQMRLVYATGKSYGYELDRGHIKDFLATVGVGLTSQYLEQAGRKLLGGLLGKVGGGLLRGMGNQAVSSGMSFASTYALGHVAKRYYDGGRTLSAASLKQTFADVMQQASGMQSRYLPAMQEKARTLDAGKVLALVRGGDPGVEQSLPQSRVGR